MTKMFLSAFFGLVFVAESFGQYAAAPPQQVNINQGPMIPQQPPMVPVPSTGGAPPPVTPPTYEGWRDGWRESWVHEYRPYKERDYMYPQQPSVYHSTADGWYWNPSTANYQRDCPPSVQINQYPQYQYQYPQYQYQYPQYQYRPYCQQTYCQPTYYYYPQRSCWDNFWRGVW